MKVFVTGGSGFIGSNIVKLLLNKGHEVTVYDNLSTGYKINLYNLNVKLIEGDIRDYDLISNAMSGNDVVFHLAAHIGNVKSINNPKEDSDINLIGTLNVLDSMRKNNVKKIVYSSSAAIFGELKTNPISEEHPAEPDSPYGVSKLAAEKMVLCYGKLHDITTVCLRYFNVYGVNQRYDSYGNVIPIFLNRIKKGLPLIIYGDGNQTRDFINVKDVARANLLAAEKCKKSDFFNLGCGSSITINKLAEYIHDISNINNGVIFEKPRKGEVLHCKANISKIQDRLGFEPRVDIEGGLREYVEWFLKLQ